MLSVITPVFNGEKHIECCISNVILQNCSDMEHIIVDGGSTDKTVEIIRLYATRHQHIRFISEKDKGQSDAMNKGLEMAKGTIIGFLNADDFYEPGVLSKVLQLFKTLPEPSFVAGNCNVVDGSGKLLYVNKPSRLQFKDMVSGYPFPVNPSAYFYHKSLHNVIGGYDTDEEYAMDLDFLLRAVQYTNVVYVNETWGNTAFCEGTKSYNDVQKDLQFKRLKKMLRKYDSRLDPVSRLEARTKFFILETGRSCIRILRSLGIYPEWVSNYIRH